MKLIHTSDWHLGAQLFGRRRHEEHASFFQWLLALIDKEQVAVLLVAGDIFDNTTPSHSSQELYYSFLQRLQATCCQHVVIIGGNHDSPSLLEAPQGLLRPLNIHIIGASTGDHTREVLHLRDKNGKDSLLVCAVPYLREKDLRLSRPGESAENKTVLLKEAIVDHYRQVIALGREKQQDMSPRPALVVMGHLFAAGGYSTGDDGSRELYLGSLGMVDPKEFSKDADYLALGHLHRAQQLGDCHWFRYSGSALPMSFAPTDRQKSVSLVELDGPPATVTEVSIPSAQRLERLRGSTEEILAGLEELRKTEQSVWLEVQYTGERVGGELRNLLEESVTNSSLEILRVINKTVEQRTLAPSHPQESLDDLSVHDVFHRCLADHGVADLQSEELTARFARTLKSLQERDQQA